MAERKVTEKRPAAVSPATHPPSLSGPKAPAKPLSFFAVLRAMKDNPLATIPVGLTNNPSGKQRAFSATS
jgi:hypothetical protein